MDLRTVIWDSMLDAEMRCRYFQRQAARAAMMDKALSFLVALFASGAVGVLVAEIAAPWPHVLALLAAGCSVGHAVLGFRESSATLGSLHESWSRLSVRWDSAWVAFEAGETLTRADVDALRDEEGLLAGKAAKFWRRPKMVAVAQDDVIRARGLA